MLRRGNDIPTNRVFIDKNGFRHYWDVFADKIQRKSGLIANIQENDKKDTKNNDKTVTDHTNEAKTKVKRKLPKRKKIVEDLSWFKPVSNENALRQGNETRTIARTSFFCPFFGVITMTSYLD
jgi:hypothetical protein